RRTCVGIDIGGGARHRRGARVAMGPAPLRETMAAQLIMLSRWDARTEPLVDPMAGGGTIPIEAAGLAVGAAIRKPLDLPLRHLLQPALRRPHGRRGRTEVTRAVLRHRPHVRALPRLARGLLRRESAVCRSVRTRSSHDETCEQCGAPR